MGVLAREAEPGYRLVTSRETGGCALDAMHSRNGFTLCRVHHRDDLHVRDYQYAHQFLYRDEARRIAKAISRLPELLKRPQY